MNGLLIDVRYTLRLLPTSRALTIAATLAIGANLVVFRRINIVRLRDDPGFQEVAERIQ